MYAQCNVPGVEGDEVTIFLAVTLIQKTNQAAGIQVLHQNQVVKEIGCGILMILMEKIDIFLCR